MYKNKAFISYRHTPRDMAAARLIQKKLEQYRIPRAVASAKGMERIGRIFLDQTDLGGKPDLTEELQKELDSSEFLIVICSPDTKESRWVKEEILYFLKHHHAAEILPVISAGNPREVLSGVFMGIDGLPPELKACDFSGSRGRAAREEIPRLASVLIGCEYDDLILRDRRFRRKKAIAVMAVAVFLISGIAVLYSFSSARLKKSHEEQLASEAQRLAGESESALEKRQQFDAVRYALQAFPDGEEEPAAGGAICSLQKSVGAYVTEGRKAYAQADEFSVDGLIDDWDYTETGNVPYLAIQYEKYGQYALAVWNVEERRLVLDIKAMDYFPSERAMDSNDSSSMDMGSTSLFVSSGTIFWSYGEYIASIDPVNGQTIWIEQTENAYQQTILAGSGNIIASLVFSAPEGDSRNNTETLQFRNAADGSLLPQGVLDLSGGETVSLEDGYTEYPKALFSEGGKSLILEEDIHYYEASDDDTCILYRIDLGTFERTLLVKEKEILDFSSQDRRNIILAAADDIKDSGDTGSICLKKIDRRTGKEAWSESGAGMAEDFACIIPGREIVLLAGVHGEIFSSESGEKTGDLEFPAPVAAAFKRTETADRQILEVISQEGDLFTWEYGKGERTYQASLFPAAVSRAGKLDDSILLFCTDDSQSVSQERIMLFRDGVWDRELIKVSLPDEGEIPVEMFYTVVSAENRFVIVGENGKSFGIDAESGKIIWSAFVGADIELAGISEHNGIMLFSVLSDPSETEEEQGGSWTVLDMMTGKVNRINQPVAELAKDTGHIEYYGSTLAGCYLEFIVCVCDSTSEAGTDNNTYIGRYSLNDGILDAVDISEYMDGGTEDYRLYGNNSGKNTVCMRVDPVTDHLRQFINIDWNTKEALPQEVGEDLVIHSNIPAKWGPDESELAVVDKNGKIHLFSIGRDGSSLLPGIAKAKNGTNQIISYGNDDRYSCIAGYDFYKDSLITVKAQDNRIWFRDEKEDISLQLPTTPDNALDPQLIREMEGWADVSVTETWDRKMFLKYGDEAFVINPVSQFVEMEIGGFLCFNPVSDTMLIKDQAGLYIAKRYTVTDLIRKGKKILYGEE